MHSDVVTQCRVSASVHCTLDTLYSCVQLCTSGCVMTVIREMGAVIIVTDWRLQLQDQTTRIVHTGFNHTAPLETAQNFSHLTNYNLCIRNYQLK